MLTMRPSRALLLEDMNIKILFLTRLSRDVASASIYDAIRSFDLTPGTCSIVS